MLINGRAKSGPWLQAEERRLALFALGARLIFLLVTTALDALLPDYDTSKDIRPVDSANATVQLPDLSYSAPQQLSPPVNFGLLQGWLVWDSVFYADVASRGYVFEQYYAFFPLLPALVSWAPRPLFPLLALSINAAASVTATVLLYRLGCRLTRDRRLAAVACVFFVLNPATVFFTAAYTEALFSAATLAALYALYCRGRLLPAVLAVLVSCGLRSNGVVNAGFLGHYCISRAMAAWPTARARGGGRALLGVALAALALTPLVLFQRAAFVTFCRGDAPLETLAVMTAAAAARDREGGAAAGSVYGGDTSACDDEYGWPRPWCSSRVPYVYGFVQSLYWNVGFLRYWTPSQLPNFLLAAPVLLLSCLGLAEYCAANAARVLRLALEPLPLPPDPEPGSEGNVRDRGTGPRRPATGPPSGGREEERVERSNTGGQGPIRAPPGGGHEQLRRRTRPRLGRNRGFGSGAEGVHDNVNDDQHGSSQEGDSFPSTSAILGAASSARAPPSGAAASLCAQATGYLAPDLAVFMYPWAFNVVVAVTAMHVQVATRFLLSSCPPLYWYMAHRWLTAAAGGEKDAGGVRPLGGVRQGRPGEQQYDGGLNLEGHGRRTEKEEVERSGKGICGGAASEGGGAGWPRGEITQWLCGDRGVLLWRWCFLYMALGSILFVNFLPWT